MAYGIYYDNNKLDVTIPFTRRRVTEWSATANTIVLKIVASMPSVNPGDWMKVEDCATWANGIWKLKAKSTHYLYLTKPGLTAKDPFVLREVSRARVSKCGNPSTNPPLTCTSFPESRRLSRWFTYNTDLTGNFSMCANQVRVKDILTQFWNMPEIKWEYGIKSLIYANNWTNYGPQTYNTTKLVNACMCIIYGSSHWNSRCKNGLDANGQTQPCLTYVYNSDTQLDSNFNVGLWGIFPKKTEYVNASWNVSSTDTIKDYTLLTNPEYNTRVALWIMFERLFNDTKFTSPADKNPFSGFPAAKWDPTTKLFINTSTKSCWGSGCSNCPPYGTSLCS